MSASDVKNTCSSFCNEDTAMPSRDGIHGNLLCNFWNPKKEIYVRENAVKVGS